LVIRSAFLFSILNENYSGCAAPDSLCPGPRRGIQYSQLRARRGDLRAPAATQTNDTDYFGTETVILRNFSPPVWSPWI
jgi:hypothetical protein